MDIDDPVYRDCSDGPRVIAPSPWTERQKARCEYCGMVAVYSNGRWWHYPIVEMNGRIIAEVEQFSSPLPMGIDWSETEVESKNKKKKGLGGEFTYSAFDAFDYKGLEERITRTMYDPDPVSSNLWAPKSEEGKTSLHKLWTPEAKEPEPKTENEYVCPGCDSTKTLRPENPKLKGLVWFHCGKCSDWSQHEVR